MTKRLLCISLTLLLTLLAGPLPAELNNIKLVRPDFSKGKTVLEALRDRKSDRVYDSDNLSGRHISEVLWAAGGINRDSGAGEKLKRTAPSANNDQSITIYAVTKNGVYRYDPMEHELIGILAGDHRSKAGLQSYVTTAPLNLIYVSDLSKVTGDTKERKLMSAAMDAGHISQNVYLYCASAGLNTIARSSIDQDEIRNMLKLDESFEPLLGQTVGQPK